MDVVDGFLARLDSYIDFRATCIAQAYWPADELERRRNLLHTEILAILAMKSPRQVTKRSPIPGVPVRVWRRGLGDWIRHTRHRDGSWTDWEGHVYDSDPEFWLPLDE